MELLNWMSDHWVLTVTLFVIVFGSWASRPRRKF